MNVKELKQHLQKYPKDYVVCMLFGMPSYVYDVKLEDDNDEIYDICCNPYDDYDWDTKYNELDYYDTVGKLLDKLDECNENKLVMMYDNCVGSSLLYVTDGVRDEKGELIVDTAFIVPLIHVIG